VARVGWGIETPRLAGHPHGREARWQAGSSTFVRNMTLPVHRWFRFPAGFSAEWAQAVIEDERRAVGGRAVTLQVWRALRRVCRPGARVCFVVGDSAPYGVHVPVERWLGELAVRAGFRGWRFERIRDRNVKWKNRKHRVPLHEGLLWVTG